MKKIDLKKLAILGITAGLTLTSGISADTSGSNGADHYVCSNYNNCGKCGGKCNAKNPATPGLTPEEKKQAEEYQAKQKEKKKGKKPVGPPKPSPDDCGAVYCNAAKDTSANRADMKAKRENLR